LRKGTARTTTGAATITTTTRGDNENWYPDHAVFNTTKDQLKAMNLMATIGYERQSTYKVP
jgi:hypothetical protein